MTEIIDPEAMLAAVEHKWETGIHPLPAKDIQFLFDHIKWQERLMRIQAKELKSALTRLNKLRGVSDGPM